MHESSVSDPSAPQASSGRAGSHWGTSTASRELAIGTLIAAAMATLFAVLSSGNSLRVTFVPGVAFAWSAFVWMHAKRVALPPADRVVPAFFAVLAIQFVHFAEEYTTGFNAAFPELYGGDAFALPLFVTFNMASYALFAVSCLLVFYKGIRPLLVPVLFFAVYGAIGNAISHTWWAISTDGYFPGFWTALAYWIAGPWLLFRLTGSKPLTASLTISFALTLITLLTVFAVT